MIHMSQLLDRMLVRTDLKELLHKKTQHVFLFAVILSLVAITYWPTMTTNYAFADDYYCLWNDVLYVVG